MPSSAMNWTRAEVLAALHLYLQVPFGQLHQGQPKPKPKTVPKSPDAGDGKNKKGDGGDAPTHGLPKYVLLTNDGRKVGEAETQKWPDGFTEHDGGGVHDLGDEGLIYPKSGSYPDAGRLVGGLNGPSVDAILSLT